jgi:hypothetical protein
MRKKKTISMLCALALVANLLVGASAFAGQDEAIEDSFEPTAPLEEVVEVEAAEDADETTEETASSPEENAVSVDEEEAEDEGSLPLSILSQEGAASLAPLAASVSLLGAETVAVPGATGGVVNYLVLSVEEDAYTGTTYQLNGIAAVPSLVLDKGTGSSKIIKLAVPAGAAGTVSVTSAGASTNINESVAIGAGVAAPGVLYGTTPLAFSEFFYDVTADVTAVEPTVTSFAAGGAVAEPEFFIAAGTKSGELYPGNVTWANSKNSPAVDAISTATFGDSVHFAVSKAVDLSYSGDDVFTKGAGHAITNIKAVDVAVSFDLLANATLLEAFGEATDQSSAVLEKIEDITWTDASNIYKPKHLFADASWGKRAESVVTAATKSFPTITTTSTSYGGNWTTRQYTVNFDLASANTDAVGFWDNYLDYIYGGYIEEKGTGKREPLVWLQNLFSHKMHTNFDVSINDSIFERFSDFKFPGNFKIVVYAAGFEDIVLDDVHLADYINGSAVIEQGTTFNVSASDSSTWFEDAQLHIQGAAEFNATTARLYKGQVEVNPLFYSFEEDGSEIALSFNAGFFIGDYQGSYTARLVADTDEVKSKPLTFTVNKLVAWPTLSVEDGAQGVSIANNEATPLSVPLNKKVSLSDANLAKSFVLAGRGTVSSVQDLTNTSATVAVTDVIKRDSADDPYYLDASTLTVGHSYRLNLAATNYSVATAPNTYSTTLSYYITVANAQAPGPNTVTDPTTGITVTAAAGIPLEQLVIAEIPNLADVGLGWLKHAERDLSVAYDIHFTSYVLANGETITISFPLKEGVAKDGDTVLVHHGYDVTGQRYEALEPVAANGRVEINASSLSPFALHAGEGGAEDEEDESGSGSGSGSKGSTSSTTPTTGDASGSQLLFTALLFMILGALGLFGVYLRRDTDPRFRPLPRRKNS